MSYDYDADPPALWCTRCGAPAVGDDFCPTHLDDYHAAMAEEAAAFNRELDAEVAGWRRGYVGRSYDYLAESYGMGAESYSETYAQYRSEVGLYGDAWPGSARELAYMKAHLALLEELLAAHPDRPAPKVVEPSAPWSPTEEEPF